MEEEVVEENKKGFKFFLTLIAILFVIMMLIFYWFIPVRTISFGKASGNYNFTINNLSSMQFYENMRYYNSDISYNIYNCTLEKQNEMEDAFGIIGNETVLNFYSVRDDEEISVYCQEKNKFKEGLFIAGEGGPTNITKSGDFYVITHGRILLIKDSDCEKPNIALHELLHALGFNHSENPNNIMYPILSCEQTIGEDIPKLIDEIYSFQNYPDLVFGNVSAVMHGKYLDANISVRNNGLAKSKSAGINIYADGKHVDFIVLKPLDFGEGVLISIKNAWVPKITIDKLNFYINTSFEELEEKNNKITLNKSVIEF
jgi:hypothetical protein